MSKYNKYVDGHILQGDMNFHSEEENQIYQSHQISDSWLCKYDIKNNPGYTFDSHQNQMINEKYWGFERRRMRLDRILFKTDILKVK